MRSLSPRSPFGRLPPAVIASLLTVGALAAATAAVAILEQAVSIPYAAPVYLLAVLTVGIAAGTVPAILTAVASFLLYDFLFIPPLFTLTVSDPNEWLNLLLFLAVAVAIGQLAALQTRRAEEAAERAREAQALFRISRSLATSDNLVAAAQGVLIQLAESLAVDRIWLGLGPTPTQERIVADTAPGSPLPLRTWHIVLGEAAGDEPARWVRAHVPAQPGRPRDARILAVHRVRVVVPGEELGSLWLLRPRTAGDPDRVETRILSAAAAQLGQAVRRERLVSEAFDAEVARRSDALKSALLDSVSHDLRTPLATIRATAGSLLDPEVQWTPAERRDALRSIDAEAERMNRLVRNLLDLSRIEGGALKPELEPYDVDEIVGRVLRRIPTAKTLRAEIPGELPPVLVDDTYLDEVLTNLVENAVRYGGPTVAVRARPADGSEAVEIAVEDDGPGVPDADLDHLFEKFYRVRRPGEGARHGMGIGLTVAQGLTRAMHGEIEAGRSTLGGLAFRIRLPAVGLPPEAEVTGRDEAAGAGQAAGAGEAPR